MNKLLLVFLLIVPTACSKEKSVDWAPLVKRSESLLQQSHLQGAQVQELGALDLALTRFYDDFFEFIDSDASLLSVDVWEARECLLAMHQSGNFYGPMPTDGSLINPCIGSSWREDDLLLLAEFFPPEDSIWDAFLHAAKAVWEQSDAFPDYAFCRSVWTAATYALGNWQEQERFAAWAPSWQAGVRINVVLLHEGLLSSQKGKLPPGYGNEVAVFRATAEQMLAFYETVTWDELKTRDPFEFGTALSATSKEAQWPAGVFTAEGILELRRLKAD